MTNDFIEIDVRLLILRYSRKRVLEVLARTGNVTIEDIERQLQASAERVKPKPTKRSVMDLAIAEADKNPALLGVLQKIATAFENRAFLPQLRDIVRFLDRNGVTHGKLKSRSAAAPVLFRLLAGMPEGDLNRLAAPDKAAGESDYDLLSRAIMGTPQKKEPDSLDGK